MFLGRHSFILTADPDGITRLTNHEEFSGALTTLRQRFMRQSNDNGYTDVNAGLKRHVEGRATGPPRPSHGGPGGGLVGDDRRVSGFLPLTSERSGRSSLSSESIR